MENYYYDWIQEKMECTGGRCQGDKHQSKIAKSNYYQREHTIL